MKSSQFPGVPESTFVERQGVLRVARTVNDARCLWREVLAHDVGIDGYIEYVHRGQSTGHQIAVQVKTGSSYINRDRSGRIRFVPNKRHKRYWEHYLLPVILILVDPSEDRAYWVDARSQLREGRVDVLIDTSTDYSRFDADGVLRALKCAGPLPWNPTPVETLVENLICGTTLSPQYQVTFLEIFTHGIFNFGQSLYFSTDLVDSIAAENLLESGSSESTEPEDSDHDIVWDYLDWLSGSDLARIDHDALDRDVMTCSRSICLTIAPLTERGRVLAEHLSKVMEDRPSYRELMSSKHLEWIGDVEIGSRRAEILELRSRLEHLVFEMTNGVNRSRNK